jgi:endonuclease-3
MTLPAVDLLPGKLDGIRLALRGYYGEPALKERRDPLSELVMTILSQNTNDTNSGRAYASLRQRFPSWQAVLAADGQDLAEAIRVGGLANVKAPRIQQILRRVRDERGALSLDFLDAMTVAEAREYLLTLPGVGPKTAACVLLFSLHKPALPVDTHVHRVSQRLGLTPLKTSAEKAHELLEALVPADLYYPFHLLLIEHGRSLCHARRPACGRCPVSTYCDYLPMSEAAV